MTESRIWASGILAILLLALLCTWAHFDPSNAAAPNPSLATPAVAPAAPGTTPANPATPAAATAQVTPSMTAPVTPPSESPSAAATTATSSPPDASASTPATLVDPSLKADFAAGKITLTGVVPDQTSKDAMLARAAKIYGASQVIDKIAVRATSQPAWFVPLATRFPPDLRGVRNASSTVQGGSLTLEGEVANESDREKLGDNALRLYSPDLKIENRIRVAATPNTVPAAGSDTSTPQVLGDGLGTVYFGTASAVLSPRAKQLLRMLSRDIKALPAQSRFEVSGFTDARGDKAYNVQLSERRAKSVQNYLSKLGVSAERISVEAKGPANPAADNSTADGRRQNRRVEVKRL